MSLPWFRVDNDLADHPKVWALSQQLSDPNAGWYVIRLWSWTSRYSSRGRIADGLRTALEFACGWRGEAGKLVSALVSAGFLDQLESGDLEVHDWWEQQGAAVAKAEKDAERQRAARKRRADAALSSTGRHADGHADERGDGAGTRRDETRRDETKVAGSPPASAETVTKPPKKPKPEKPTDPRHAPLVATLVQVFAETRGADYGFSGRDARAVTELLALAEPDVVTERWRRALAHTGFPTIAAISNLVTHWNRFAGDGPRKPSEPSKWTGTGPIVAKEFAF